MSDDRHPEELLAGYVDGSLSERERAVVESHLSTCARCREESGLAMHAVATLNDLDDVPVPVGVMSPVTAELAQRMSRTAPRPLSQRVLWAAGGAIAAAFVGLVAIWVLPGIGANDNGAGRATAPEAAAASGTTVAGAGGGGALSTAGTNRGLAVTLEHRPTNYDNVALARLATQAAADAGTGALGPAADATTQPSATRSALECVRKGAEVEPQDVLVRLISAQYAGEPAYVAVFLTGPAPSQPPKSVLVWVVHADGCTFASFTSKRG
ncbi:MAG: zf-HC2 domain-containing protein [Actinomycetota bacterium]